MRRLYTYMLLLLALAISCQRIDLPEESPTDKPACAIGGKATITFSTDNLQDVPTKAIIDPSVDVETMHLVLFDENGMLVEVCEAIKLGSSNHDNHTGGHSYTVTLTVTDKPRKIHFIANCPLDQIVYGHESSIIGNMYVDKNDREHKTTYETSYWARIEVPYILVEEKEETLEDGTKRIVVSLHSSIKDKFEHVPLLRNYAMLTVENKITDNTFRFEGYTVYNIIDRGTVAPYNNKTQQFQSFLYTNESNSIVNYTYPQLSGAPFYYEGHALSSATLITDYARNSDGTVKIFKSGDPFYIYERKISVMTDEEEKWKESPPHIIIKGKYNNDQPVTDASPTYYYKMDLVYTTKDAQNYEEIEYYNILRNFRYQFNLTDVHDVGYNSLEEAVAGAAGNNISGSSSTSTLTNVSDNEGRLWVSYTDTTLVNGTEYKDNGDAINPISFKFKYIPNYYDNTKDDYQQTRNDLVRFDSIIGDVITGEDGFIVETNDITEGSWAGYRNVSIHIKQPDQIIHQQILELKTNSAHLNRDIRYTLREKLAMVVECTPKVAGNMKEEVTVDIKLPDGLTDDMFPLALNIETLDRTLSPNAQENTIPVTAGPSIIDVDGRRGENSFFYTVTIPTLAAYKALPSEGVMKVYTTHWYTNKAANASTVYVDNKYFNQAHDSWENYTKTFSNVSISETEIPLGAGREVTVSFTMPNTDNSPVTLTMTGLKDASGNSTIIVTPTNGSSSNVTVSTNGNNKTVKVTGLYTTSVDGAVKVNIDANGYKDENLAASRTMNQFGVTGFNPSYISGSGDLRNLSVEYTFTIPTYYPDMVVNVTLDGLVPNDKDGEEEDRLVEVEGRSAIRQYTFAPGAAGTYVLKLKTINKDACTCSLRLEAEDYYYETVTSTVGQGEVHYEFNATTNRDILYSNQEATITFEIPAEAYQTGMKVNITLDGLTSVNNGNKLTGSNGSYVYTINNKAADNKYTFNVKPSGTGAGERKVTLEASTYLFTTETITIQQRVSHALMAKNTNTKDNSNVYDVQAVYQLKNPLTNGQSYELSFYVKADSQVSGQIGVFLKKTSDDGAQRQYDDRGQVTTQWKEIKFTVTANQDNFNMIAINIGKVLPTNAIYFDNVSLKHNGTELIINGDFEESSPDNWDFVEKHADDWWTKVNTGATPVPSCTLSIVSPGRE